MNPAVAALIVELIKDSPTIIAELKTLFSKGDPTPEDWLALKARVQATSFESLAPDAKTS